MFYSSQIKISKWIETCFLVCLGILPGQGQDTLTVSDSFDFHHIATKDRGYYFSSDVHDAAVNQVPDFAHVPTTVDRFLQGTVSGLSAVQSSGQPGGGLSLQIRGIHSLFGSTQPLYIIDGIPFYPRAGYATGGTVFGPALNPLSFLSTDHIGSISILKDAASLALYGSRASNGVVIIRTKRAKQNEPGISATAEVGWQDPIGSYEMANASQFASFLNQGLTNTGLQPLYNNPESFGIGTNWQELISRNQAIRQKYNLDLSGGNEKISFLLQGSVFTQQGIVIGSDLRRYSMHANIDAEINKKLNLINSFNFSRLDASTIPSDASHNRQSIDAITGSRIFNPLLSHLNSDGLANTHNFQVSGDGLVLPLLQGTLPQPNPLLLAGTSDSEISYNLLSNFLSLHFDLLKNLRLESSIGINAVINDESTFAPGSLFFNAPSQAQGTAAKLQSFQFVNQYLLNYKRQVSEKHNIRGMMGFITEGYRREFLAGESIGFENETLRFYSLSVGQQKSLQSDLSRWALQSFIGRIEFEHDDVYSLALAARSDASSIFGEERKIFPSIAAKWNLHRQSLFANLDKLSGLILRASYGITGNSNLDPYSRFAVLDQFSAALDGSNLNGIGISKLGNESLEIETTRRFNAGLHLDFHNRRYLVDVDFYHHLTDNAFLPLPISASNGFSMTLVNGAEISNKGVDLSFAINHNTHRVNWVGQITAHVNSNKIESIRDDLSIEGGSSLIGISRWMLLRSGQKAGSFYGYETNGLMQAGENPAVFAGQKLTTGDQKYRDQNGDGIINAEDKVVLGQGVPEVSLGLINKFQIGALDFSLHLHSALGHEVANFNKILLEDPSGQHNVSIDYLNRAGKDLPVPRSITTENYIFSDRYIENGSYLRLRNITLGFTLPEKMIEKVAKHLRIYLRAENIWTLTGYSGIDPDVSHFGDSPVAQGVDLGSYPKAKSIIVGLNLKL